MSKLKTVRDALIILVIIILALAVYASRNPSAGPVEQAQNRRSISMDGHNHGEDMGSMTMMHGMVNVMISDRDQMQKIQQKLKETIKTR